MAAFTVERWNGLVMRKVGSGRVPVSSRSGNAVMKMTGTENSARISFTASMPLEIIGELDVGEHEAGRVLPRLRNGFVAGHGDAGDVVAEIANDRLDVHRDDRFVFDDQDIGQRLPFDLFERFGHKAIDVLRARTNQIGRVFR